MACNALTALLVNSLVCVNSLFLPFLTFALAIIDLIKTIISMNKADIVNKACFNLFISIVDNTISDATNVVIDKAIFIKVLALVFLVNAFKASDTSPKTSEKS